MIEIDGAQGEGGGQILRSALSLSMCTQQSFRIRAIRAGRAKPGLLRQHLTALRAAQTVCGGTVEGDQLGSTEVTFRPGAVVAGDYRFDVGSAGSCTLVLQTVLPALMLAAGSSTVRITGGTHAKAAPPVDFLQLAFLPLLARMGPRVSIDMTQPGFYPRGGGVVTARIEPTPALVPLQLMERGAWVGGEACAYVAAIPMHVAERELEVVGRTLGWGPQQRRIKPWANEFGPGNALTLTLTHEHVTEVCAAFGEKTVRAEDVAGAAVREAQGYLATRAAVGAHLADQLQLPLALAGGGCFTAAEITPHFVSNGGVIEQFTGRRFECEPDAGRTVVTLR
jgi:RNA 3'-terminal phosphate cyclase (ATP)